MRESDWNHYIINANGTKVSHKLNNAVCNDHTSSVTEGTIGLQMHFLTGTFTATSTTTTNFKDVFIRPLNNSFEIPDSLAVFLKADYTATAGSSGLAGFTAGDNQLRPMFRGNRLGIPGMTGEALISIFDPLGRAKVVRKVHGLDQGTVWMDLPNSGSRISIVKVSP